jgi:CheY-like chemotaxis protein
MLDRPSILVIDDEPDNFDVLQMLLGDENYTFHYAASGQRAIDRLDIFQPKLILLDVMMPDLDGIEVCRQIRSLPKWQSVPILMVSALSGQNNIEQCLAAGADGFISKPVNRRTLINEITSLLNRSSNE